MRDAFWAQIPEFPDFFVSDDGRVVNSKTKRVMKVTRRPGFSFSVVKLNKNNKQYERSVNALQKAAFLHQEKIDEYTQKEKQP